MKTSTKKRLSVFAVVFLLVLVTVGVLKMNERMIQAYDDSAMRAGRAAKLKKNERIRAYNYSAMRAGRAAKWAEYFFYMEALWPERFYSNELSDLLMFDRSLTDFPGAPFRFGSLNTSGLTFSTTHSKGSSGRAQEARRPKGFYSNQLSDLLKFNRSLDDDPEVTFIFGTCNTSGFTFTTTHSKGSSSYLYPVP